MADDFSVTEIDKIKHDKIEKAREFEKNVNEAINVGKELREDVQKIKEEICEGPDCLKVTVDKRFGEIDEKIKKIEEKSGEFVCEVCNYAHVPALVSFCPNCGSPIYEWNDDNGEPIKGWKHWSERNT